MKKENKNNNIIKNAIRSFLERRNFTTKWAIESVKYRQRHLKWVVNNPSLDSSQYNNGIDWSSVLRKEIGFSVLLSDFLSWLEEIETEDDEDGFDNFCKKIDKYLFETEGYLTPQHQLLDNPKTALLMASKFFGRTYKTLEGLLNHMPCEEINDLADAMFFDRKPIIIK